MNSMKVHTLDCESASRISEKNKQCVNDTLMSICSKGYIICKNCNAGLSIKDIRLKYELPTKEEYLKAIDEVGEWYVNNVPTYQKEISTELLSKYDGNDEYIGQYDLKTPQMVYKFKIYDDYDNYNVISSNSKYENINKYDKDNTYITKANENAVRNYIKNYNDIDFESYLSYYDCPYLHNSTSTYKKAGDDCVRFVFTILNYIDNSFIKDIEDLSGNEWKDINSTLLNSNNRDMINAMMFKGFEVFDIEGIINVENNYYLTKIHKIDSTFNLKNGDLLVRNGHIHVFIDDKMNDAKNFGWGHVSRRYPQYYNFSIESEKDYNYIICGNEPEEKYTRVYRFIGGPK